ncbi:SLBB domain-containing protein, partial [Candidatus Poribacteria bacterium]|nr:SLBB domain-containing protein [Candidatus Poribacteria bacterium]
MKIHSVIVWFFLILFLVVLDCRCFAQAAEAERKVGETLETAIPQEQQTEGETPPQTKAEVKVEAVKKIAQAGQEITSQSRFKELRPFGHNLFDTAPSAFAPPTGVPVGPDYPLGPGDSLTVQIWGNQLLTSLIEKSVSGESNSTTESKTSYKVIVTPQGNIFFPRIGVITVLGMTVEGLERELEKRLSEIYAGVKVGVMLTSLRTITVFVIGEVQRPGSYTVNSLSTVFNALYVAGGPNTRGSMRNIKFIRNGKTSDTVDLYRYLLEGDKSQDYRLEAGDTLFVPPVGMKVAIAGEVLRPAAYEFKGKVTLKDVVDTAGGILPSAYTQRIQVDRVQDNKRVLFDIDALKLAVEEKSEIEILDGDTIFVFSVLDIYRNRVTILGNVKRPGIYELKPDMRVSRLVEEAEGIFDDTYLNRAEIYRLREDSTTEIIPFNLSNALNLMEGPDVKLQNRDKVFIYSYATVEQTPYVRVTGQVKSPEAYPLTSNTKVSDLIFRANGIKPKEAYLDRADVFRLNADGSVIVIPVNLKLVLDGDLKADILLHENDDLVVYSKEQLNKIPHVQIQGAVGYPGTYTLALNMKIKDLFFMAGGLTKDAYALRAELIRTKDTGEIQIMPFNPYSLFHENDEKENLELQNYDKIIVYLKGEAERRKRKSYRHLKSQSRSFPRLLTSRH